MAIPFFSATIYPDRRLSLGTPWLKEKAPLADVVDIPAQLTAYG
jgi:hypothetical protein